MKKARANSRFTVLIILLFFVSLSIAFAGLFGGGGDDDGGGSGTQTTCTGSNCETFQTCTDCNCLDGTGDSKVCIEYTEGPTFKATISFTASGGNAYVNYLEVFDNTGAKVATSLGGPNTHTNGNICYSGSYAQPFDLPTGKGYTYKVWRAFCVRSDVCEGCGDDEVVMTGGPFGVTRTGCYNKSGEFSEPGSLTIENFWYYAPTPTQTYSKEILGAAGITNPIACNGDDIRISCEDKGVGNNHKCELSGTNGCNAREDTGNLGTAGCRITCEKIGDKQTEDADSSKEACSCFKVQAWNETAKCCGDDTDDCGKISGGSICNIESDTASFVDASSNKGDIKYINCSNLEYLSDGVLWSECNGKFWKKSVLSHDYLCSKIGKESIAECCGDGTCNSKTDGKRLEDGQIVEIGGTSSVSIAASKLTISPDPFIIGNTPLNSRLTNADPTSQVLLYNKKDGVLISDGVSVGSTNNFGNKWTIIPDVSSIEAGSYETYVTVNGKKSNVVNWKAESSGGNLAIIPETIIQGQISLQTTRLTNSDPDADVKIFNSIDGQTFADGGILGRTNSAGTLEFVNSDTSGLAVGGYLSYVVVNGKKSTTAAWNVAKSNVRPVLLISPTTVPRGQTEIKFRVIAADPDSPVVFFNTYNNESYGAVPVQPNTDSSGNYTLILSSTDSENLDLGAYKTYVTVNGKRSIAIDWKGTEPTSGSTSGTTYYCRTDNRFVTDLDTIEGKTTCEKAGHIWTGTKCCSEADDKNEYYNDDEGTGGCWDKNFISAGSFVNGTNNSVLNSKGVFHGCVLEKTNYNTANDKFLDVKDYHAGTQLVTNHPYCELDPSKNYFCSYTEKWVQAQGINRTHLSLVPAGAAAQKGECCPDKKCWDGAKCLDSQKDKPFETFENKTNSTTAFRCIDGDWTESSKKCTADGAVCAFCPKATQCLSDPFAKTESSQCIDSGKFVGDNYCNNGEWATRTNILISTMLSLRDNDYSLFCDSKDNAINYLQYKTSSNELASSILNRLKVNNVCVLKNSNEVIIGTTLNQDAANISSKDWSVLKLQKCDQSALVSDGNYHPCDSSDKVWFNNDLISIIYGGKAITISENNDLLGLYKSIVKDAIEQIKSDVEGLIEAPPVDDSYTNPFKKLDRIYLESQQGKEAVGAIDGVQFKNLVINYDGFDTDICKAISDYNSAKGLDADGIACIKNGDAYYLLGQGGSLLNFNPDAIWQDLTSKLRIK